MSIGYRSGVLLAVYLGHIWARLQNITPHFFEIVAIDTFPYHACPAAGRLAGAPERGEMALIQLHAPDRQYNAFLRCLSGEMGGANSAETKTVHIQLPVAIYARELSIEL